MTSALDLPATRGLSQWDVFTDEDWRGNPLAVVHDAQGLSEADMLAFARWIGWSETTFLGPPSVPQADYQVRIWTPTGELPFAGHPTLGSCHAWLHAGGQPQQEGRVVQQCAAGLVTLQRHGARWFFHAPACEVRPPRDAAQMAAVQQALGLRAAQVSDAACLNNGPEFLALWVDHADTVLALQPDRSALRPLPWVLVAGPYSPGHAQAAVELRVFLSDREGAEDPVTGSAHAALAHWLGSAGRVPPAYVATQGQCLGRAGRVFVQQQMGREIWVGGDVRHRVQGTVMW